MPEAKNGIHIKPKNKGKFNALKKRTGKTTEELTHSKNPLTKKRAIFAQNAAKWKHEYGGYMEDGGGIDNPGFNALPYYVQQNIIDNMAMGGYIKMQNGGSKNNEKMISNPYKKYKYLPTTPGANRSDYQNDEDFAIASYTNSSDLSKRVQNPYFNTDSIPVNYYNQVKKADDLNSTYGMRDTNRNPQAQYEINQIFKNYSPTQNTDSLLNVVEKKYPIRTGYQTGGKTIKTYNPNDPAFRAYTDSTKLHNYGENLKKIATEKYGNPKTGGVFTTYGFIPTTTKYNTIPLPEKDIDAASKSMEAVMSNTYPKLNNDFNINPKSDTYFGEYQKNFGENIPESSIAYSEYQKPTNKCLLKMYLKTVVNFQQKY